jgi:predicted ATPase
LLQDARSGHSRALVLRGDPGIGKSALLEYAIDRAAGFRVLRAVGIESESQLAFSGLHQLLRPVLDGLDQIPEAAAEALSRSLALVEPGEVNPFLAYTGALQLLAAAAERGPLLAVLDDAHWLDPASAAAITFAARRLEAESVALLFGVREERRAASIPAASPSCGFRGWAPTRRASCSPAPTTGGSPPRSRGD